MNSLTTHLLSCLGEEGSEIAQEIFKCIRFGLNDRNVLDPTGPTNRERLVSELNDLLGAADLLVRAGVLRQDWHDVNKVAAKREKVLQFLDYAADIGALDDVNNLRATLR